ncbi:MAG: aquaporin [Methanobacteriota archaeon]|nr:MAG: aquaporin [Euryarchaeota archaeon]
MAIAAWRKAIAEFIGAFTLIFIGAGSIISYGGGSLLLVALAHGLAIGVMVSAFGRISGGHFNPAVTLGALVGRQITMRLAVVYWASQLLGALAAAFGLFLIFPSGLWQPSHLGTPALGTGLPIGVVGFFPPNTWNVTPVAGILIEAILTFLLVTVVYGTGIDPKGSFNAVGGFAIGLTIAIDIMMGGPLTGAAMNPARWFGPAVVSQFFDNWYVYWIGPFIGAVVAGLLYSRVFLEKAS